MKRKMIGAAAAYLAGLFFASFFTGIISAAILVFLVILIIANGIRGKDLLLISVCFIAAVAVSGMYRHFCYDRITAYSGKTEDFSGRVTGIESFAGELSMYTLEGELDGITDVKVTYFGNSLDVRYGDIIHLEKCTFSQPENDYVYRNKEIFMSEGVFLSADYPENIRAEHTHSRKLKNALMNYRENMLSRFRSEMGETSGNFLGAMVFGEKRGFDPDMKTALYRSGIGHVMAVSGIHVSVIAAMFMAVLSRLRLGRILPFVLMNILLFLFIAMAEWPISAIRALIMMDFIFSARLFRRQNDTLNSLSGAVLLICIANPFVIYSSGFLLSVTATFGIGVFGPYMTKNISGSRIIGSLLTMVCACMCIFPLTLKYFGETSLISPLTNLILLPLCSAALIIGAVFVMSGGILPVLDIAGFLLSPVLAVSEKISECRTAYFSYSGGNLIVIVFVLAAVVAVLHFVYNSRAVTAAAMSASFCAVMVISTINGHNAQKSLRIAFLGSGRNTAAVVSYNGATRIFDLSGYYNNPVYIRKYLSENGISRIDSVMLTDNEPSQYASYISELSAVEIGEWYCEDDIHSGNTDDIIIADEGISFSIGGAKITFCDDILTAELGGNLIKASPEGNRGAFIVCGDVIPHDITIDTDKNNGINNFEIKLSEDGVYEFRRL